MSMCTSPHSETMTILLWGDRWWISGQDEPVRFGELSSAASVLLDDAGLGGVANEVRVMPSGVKIISLASSANGRPS